MDRNKDGKGLSIDTLKAVREKEKNDLTATRFIED